MGFGFLQHMLHALLPPDLPLTVCLMYCVCAIPFWTLDKFAHV